MSSVLTLPAKYPTAKDFFISLKTSTNLSELQTLFQVKVWNILYLASHTNPDLSQATTQLSRRSNKATTDSLLRYLASTSHLGITFCTHGHSSNLHDYVDFSYDSYADSKSYTGIFLHLQVNILVLFLAYLRNRRSRQILLLSRNLLRLILRVRRFFGHRIFTLSYNFFLPFRLYYMKITC